MDKLIDVFVEAQAVRWYSYQPVPAREGDDAILLPDGTPILKGNAQCVVGVGAPILEPGGIGRRGESGRRRG